MPRLLTISLFGHEIRLKKERYKLSLLKKVLKGLPLKRLKTNMLFAWFKSKITIFKYVNSADVYLEDVFVPENNRLAKAVDFDSANAVLASSRLKVCLAGVSIAAGAYEAALRYSI